MNNLTQGRHFRVTGVRWEETGEEAGKEDSNREERTGPMTPAKNWVI